MKEFKVGDKIKIKSWEEMEKEFGLDPDGDIDIEPSFVQDMKHLCGRIATIDKINGNNDINLICWDNTDGDISWKFGIRMFKHVRDINFKVGETVRIRDWEDMKEEFGTDYYDDDVIDVKCKFTKKMKHLCGRTAKIKELNNNRIWLQDWSNEEGGVNWNYSTDMLEKVEPKENKQEVYTYRKGNEVISELKINDEVVKTAKARCCPTDTFDFNFGAKLSLERLFEEDKDDKGEKEVRRKAKVGDYIELIEANYSFDKVGMVLKVSKVADNGSVYVMPESYPEELEVYNSWSGNGWSYEKEWYKVLKDYVPPKKNYGKDLIGREIEAGTKFKVIKISENRADYDDLICKDEYVGKTAKFNYDFTVTDDPYGDEMGTFDKAYVEAIDEENGGICWRWDEIEILD